MHKRLIGCVFVALFLVSALYCLDLSAAADPVIASCTGGTFGSYWVIDKSFQEASTYNTAVGNGFITPNDGTVDYVTSIDLGLAKAGNPSGYLKIMIYAWSSGTTYPTGSVLATSDTKDVSGVAGGLHYETFYFSGAQRIALQPNTRYTFFVSFNQGETTDASNNIQVPHYTGTAYDGTSSKIFRWYSGAWTYCSNSNNDAIFHVYAVTQLDLAENDVIGHTQTQKATTDTLYSYWHTEGSALLDHYQFEIDTGAGYVAQGWNAFADTNNTWANMTLVLDYAIGTVINWKVSANISSGGDLYVSAVQTFTVVATVYFYFNDGGTFKRGGVALENGTATTYSAETTLEFLAIINSGYGWYNWTWTNDAGSSTANPYTYSVSNASTVWCNFAPIGSGGGPTPTPPPPTETPTPAPTADLSEYTEDPSMLAFAMLAVVVVAIVVPLLLLTATRKGTQRREAF